MPSRPSSSFARRWRSTGSPTRKIAGNGVTSISRSGRGGVPCSVFRPTAASNGMLSPWSSGDDDGTEIGPATEMAAQEGPGVLDHLVEAGALRGPTQLPSGPFGRRHDGRRVSGAAPTIHRRNRVPADRPGGLDD